MSRRLVISIDGGGIRGIIPLILLKEIQKRLSVDLFSIETSWWGTSTGALIAGGLCIQKGAKFDSAVQNILDIYEFRSTSSIQPRGSSIPSRALDQMIQANFKGVNLTQFPSLNVVVATQDENEVEVFNAENSCEVSDAIRASCAFPGLFPPVKIDGKYYVDGFLCAKNPSEVAIRSEIRKKDTDLFVLSLGTGVMRAQDAVEASVEEVHLSMQQRARSGEIIYFRFNPTLNCAVDSMQNTSPKNIMNLRKDAIAFIDQNEMKIQQFITALEKS